MISTITKLRSTSSFALNPKHVYGHRDTIKRPLTRLGQLNCKMDITVNSITIEIFVEKLDIGTIICCGDLVTSRI